MPRSIWTGAISFGLVNVPGEAVSARSTKKTVRFHQLHRQTRGSRIQQKRVDASTGNEVAYEDIVKGYEISTDHYVMVAPEELESLDPEKTRTIDIEDFVDRGDRPALLRPPVLPRARHGRGEGLPAAGRCDAATPSKVAIARVVHPQQGEPRRDPPEREGALTMETMDFADEVVAGRQHRRDRGDEDATPKTTKRELDMAQQLIDSLTSDFDPTKYGTPTASACSS